jgi:hypothetical protein
MAQAGATVYVIEQATPDSEFELDKSPTVIRVRSGSAIWQKERLMNIAIRQLPRQFTKVIWSDCDIRFEDEAWLANASNALDRHAIIQPFTKAIRLPPRQTSYAGSGKSYPSFSWIAPRQPKTLRSGKFDKHGHTGFAWGGRRAWLEECGLYDGCLSGSGDHLMAHGFCGDSTSRCVMHAVGSAFGYHSHFRQWAEQAFELTGGNLGAVEGTVLHLWHGDPKNRLYGDRDRELCDLDFDPREDLRENADGCWELTDRNPELRDWVNRYYDSRDEDSEVLCQWGSQWLA